MNGNEAFVKEQQDLINSAITTHMSDNGSARIQVLEAGGGSATHLNLPKAIDFITIDISKEQIDNNSYAKQKILGDVESHDLSKLNCDLVVCFDLLEHVNSPKKALQNLMTAVNKDNGMVFIKGPIPESLQGLVTRLTPHILHVWFYRYVHKSKFAGQPGYAPFPVEMNPYSSPKKLMEAAREMGCQTVEYKAYEGIHVKSLKNKSPFLYSLFSLGSSIMSIATLGRFGSKESDFYLALRVGAH
jgi:SAM-dependent methyltransferase